MHGVKASPENASIATDGLPVLSVGSHRCEKVTWCRARECVDLDRRTREFSEERKVRPCLGNQRITVENDPWRSGGWKRRHRSMGGRHLDDRKVRLKHDGLQRRSSCQHECCRKTGRDETQGDSQAHGESIADFSSRC